MSLAPSGKSVVYESPGSQPGKTGLMLEHAGNSSDLVEISKLNGEFKKNYGTIIGACLYLRSISAARGRSFFLDRFDVRRFVGCADVAWEIWLVVATASIID